LTYFNLEEEYKWPFISSAGLCKENTFRSKLFNEAGHLEYC